MVERQPEPDAAARLAERLLGRSAAREVVLSDPQQSVRWLEHDYPTAVARWNYHPEFEVHLIREGTGRFIIGDHIGTFEAGHLALIGSGLPHDWVSDLEPGQIIVNRDAVIQFDGDWITKSAELLPELHEISALLEASARGIEFSGATALEGAEIIEQVGSSTGLVRLQHVFGLFALLGRSPSSERRYLTDELFRPNLDPQEAAVVEFVLDHVFSTHTGPIRLSAVAELVGMRPSTFSKYFSRTTGQNFSDLVGKLRLAHARRLLTQTSDPVSTICFDVGFTNLSNFNRAFRRASGMTPRDYRRSELERQVS